jgi:hypothetical protein
LAITGPDKGCFGLGHNLRERRFPQPRRPKEQHMIQRVPALAGRFDKDPQILPRGFLAHKLIKRLRAQSRVHIFGTARGGCEAVISHVGKQKPN